jgi:hypothetical protein
MANYPFVAQYQACAGAAASNLEKEDITVFRKGLFTIEEWFGPFEGWTAGQRWNGWECPYFEFGTAMQIVDAWNHLNFGEEEHRARYDEEQDKFYFSDGGLEEWDCFGAKMIEAEGKAIKVYPIGAFYWIWRIPPIMND